MRDELGRQQRDVDELVSGLCQLQNDGLLHGMLDGYRTGAENLVSQGWTRLGPGERVIGPAEAALLNEVQCAYIRWESLKKKLKEQRAESAEVSADASELTSDVKAGSHEHRLLKAFALVNEPLYFDEAAATAAGHEISTQEPEVWDLWSGALRSLVQRGLVEALPAAEGEIRRYELTQAGRSVANGDGCGTHTGDGFREELSSRDTLPATGPSAEALILAAFAGANRPLTYTEACDAAAAAVTPRPPGDWHLWESAFHSLEQRGLIEALPGAKGKIRRYQLTKAGRGLHELDGVDARPDRRALILAAFGSCTGPENPTRSQAIAHACGVDSIGKVGADYYDWIDAFKALVEEKLLEVMPAEPGQFRRFTLTGTGVEALDTMIPSENWEAW